MNKNILAERTRLDRLGESHEEITLRRKESRWLLPVFSPDTIFHQNNQ
jgi:hypothetical protein